jgi:uncharacterized protein YuzE
MVHPAGALRVSYDQEFDVLEIFFQEPEAALTIELEEDVYAHVIPQERRIIGMTIHRVKEHAAILRALPLEGDLRPASPEVEDRISRAFALA